MALMKCPECGKEVSDRALSCPSCGYPLHENVPTKEEESPNINITCDDNMRADTPLQSIPKKKVSKKVLIGICTAIFVCILSVTLFMQGFILIGDDKAVYDIVASCADSFKNPASVRIISGTYDDGDLFARISAENGFGAFSTDNYMMSNNSCYSDDSGGAKSVYRNSSDFHTGPINHALARRFAN